MTQYRAFDPEPKDISLMKDALLDKQSSRAIESVFWQFFLCAAKES
jgi:hypothetical protein